LVQEAHTVSHFQRAVLKIGNYLIILAVALVAVIIAVARVVTASEAALPCDGRRRVFASSPAWRAPRCRWLCLRAADRWTIRREWYPIAIALGDAQVL
jgi:hypothetical protein